MNSHDAALFFAPAYKQKMVINGVDTGQLFLDTIALASQGYMKYRTVHVYPQANAQINQAISRVVSPQSQIIPPHS